MCVRLRYVKTEDQVGAHGLRQVGPYTDEAMTEKPRLPPRHGYRQMHRTTQDGFVRVFFTNDLR